MREGPAFLVSGDEIHLEVSDYSGVSFWFSRDGEDGIRGSIPDARD